MRRNTKRSRSWAICRATAAELVGCHNIALDLVERLTVGLDAMLIHALCVRGCTALWAPIFHHGSLNPIKTLSAHCGNVIRDDVLGRAAEIETRANVWRSREFH